MDHLNSFCNNFEERTNTLMKRLHGLFDDFNLKSNSIEEQNINLLKLHIMLLTAEIYEYTRQYVINRDALLSEYFGEMTLRQCLENVVEIEKLQRRIPMTMMLHPLSVSSVLIENEDENSCQTDHLSNNLYNNYKCLHENGLSEFFDNKPSIAHSVLWCSQRDDDKHYMFGRLFAKAKEPLEDNDNKEPSSDPEQLAYQRILQQRTLSRHIAKIEPSYEKFFIGETKDNIFQNQIIGILNWADDTPFDDIYIELGKALELLRNVFMTDAEDIYYIRTGDFSQLEKIYDIELIEHFYTDIPFKKYKIAKESYLEEYSEEMIVDLEQWRSNMNYTGRPLRQDEYEEYLQIRKEEVRKNMENYAVLWKLREHSGGLDVAVTPENFARMFYRRKGVDRYFIELQWQLEYLTSKIEENKVKHNAPKQSPEQIAVVEFVDKITRLVINTYNLWNNRRVVPAVHKPEVHIVIKKDELISFIQGEMKNNFDELKVLCFPTTSKSNHVFCRYVAKLREKGYFGLLPKNYLANILAPIIGIDDSTATNYLSK